MLCQAVLRAPLHINDTHTQTPTRTHILSLSHTLSGSISPTYLRTAFAPTDPKSVKRLMTLLFFLRFWAPRVPKLYVER